MSQVDIIEGHSHVCDRNHCEEFPRAAAAPPLSDSVALLVVDVQPESWSGCPQVRTDFSDFPTKLRKTIALARRRKAKIVWIRAEYSYECSPWLVRIYGKEPPYHRLSSSASWRDGVPRHSASSSSSRAARKWEAFAIPQPGDIVVTKHKSLSGTHHHTGLLSLLRQHQPSIDAILVCGIFTSVSVQHTAFGVFEAGYRTLLVEDACADRGKSRHEAALALYGNYMYEVLASKDLEIGAANGVPASTDAVSSWTIEDGKTPMPTSSAISHQYLNE